VVVGFASRLAQGCTSVQALSGGTPKSEFVKEEP
jgi:hypothetical protein